MLSEHKIINTGFSTSTLALGTQERRMQTMMNVLAEKQRQIDQLNAELQKHQAEGGRSGQVIWFHKTA